MRINVDDILIAATERRNEFNGPNIDGTNVITEFMVDFARYVNSINYISNSFESTKTYHNYRYRLSNKFEFNEEKGTSIKDVFSVLRLIAEQKDFNCLVQDGIAKAFGFEFIQINSVTIVNSCWIDVYVTFKLLESK